MTDAQHIKQKRECALSKNRINSISFKVRTTRQMYCNQSVGFWRYIKIRPPGVFDPLKIFQVMIFFFVWHLLTRDDVSMFVLNFPFCFSISFYFIVIFFLKYPTNFCFFNFHFLFVVSIYLYKVSITYHSLPILSCFSNNKLKKFPVIVNWKISLPLHI